MFSATVHRTSTPALGLRADMLQFSIRGFLFAAQPAPGNRLRLIGPGTDLTTSDPREAARAAVRAALKRRPAAAEVDAVERLVVGARLRRAG